MSDRPLLDKWDEYLANLDSTVAGDLDENTKRELRWAFTAGAFAAFSLLCQAQRCGEFAYNPHLQEGWGMCVYSCYPGGTGSFFGDMLFDISMRSNQQIPTLDSPLEQLETFTQEAKDRLFRYIDEHYEELTAPQ